MYMTAEDRFLFMMLSIFIGMILVGVIAGANMTRDMNVIDSELIIINNASYRCTMVKDLKEKQDE